MKNFQALSFIFATSLVSAAGATVAIGCGGTTVNVISGDSGTGAGQDSGTSQDTGMVSFGDSSVPPVDSSLSNADGTAPTDSGLGDASMDANVAPPSGTPVALGDNLNLWGVTDDDYAIYSDETANVLYALSLTGTTPITLTPALNGDAGSGAHSVSVSHKVVFISIDGDGDGIGTTSVWTSAAATPTIITTTSPVGSSFGIPNVASSDSTLIAYLSNFDGIGTADLFGATVTGGNPKRLLANVDISQDFCTGASAFAGASAYLAVEYCISSDNTGKVSLSTFLGTSSWNEVDQTSSTAGLTPFAFDSAGTQIAISDDKGLEVFPLGSATGKTIDAKGTSGGFFNNAGTSVLYVATNGGTSTLATSPIASPAPTTLASGFNGIYGLSPDGTTVLGFKNGDPFNGSDMWIASATAAGAPTRLGSSQADYPNGALFTTDSSRALFVDFTNGTTGILNAAKVPGGSATVLSDNAALTTLATTGAKIVFNANAAANLLSNGDGTSDIFSVDTAGSAMPTRIANQANTDFFLSHAKDKVVYVWDVAVGSNAGLYVSPIP